MTQEPKNVAGLVASLAGLLGGVTLSDIDESLEVAEEFRPVTTSAVHAWYLKSEHARRKRTTAARGKRAAKLYAAADPEHRDELSSLKVPQAFLPTRLKSRAKRRAAIRRLAWVVARAEPGFARSFRRRAVKRAVRNLAARPFSTRVET